ncbi:MAG TPA: DUF5683 domain-containing protein [Fibrobacteria bacterium]|nr:DUF5683 domain-containing protein [Fibrobacteria bacterium]
MTADSARSLTGEAAPADSAARAAAAATATPTASPASPGSAVVDTAKVRPAKRKRKRVVRETTVNTIDELKGRYRSPKKALFMSLVVPGLGQAYVGQHWSNYVRGAAYFLTDVGLALGWQHYVGTKQDRQISRYRAFADSNWRMSKYEDTIGIQASTNYVREKFEDRNTHRTLYCQAVQERNTTVGNQLQPACIDPGADGSKYNAFVNNYRDHEWPVDSISTFRSNMPNPQSFYELIGKEAEFVSGWKDAEGIKWDTAYYMLDGDEQRVAATSEMQQQYVGMRARANDYARMQAWFLGGMVINHIVSAFDAALAAHVHNKSLYQTDIGLLDRLRLDSRIGWDGDLPTPTVTASLTF